MATKQKIQDFYNPISNPAGSIPSSYNAFSKYTGNVPTPAPSLSLNSLFNPMQKYTGNVPIPPVAPAPAAAATPAVPSTPVAPAAATPAAPAQNSPAIPPQWIKPDGSFYTPQEVAANLGSTLKTSQGNGDVGTLAGNQFGAGGKSVVDLQAEAAQINNTRNDIAVGANDPYKVAADSGIAYTPAELHAIEQAYAGIYDPAITTALAKVQDKQTQDASAADAKTKEDQLKLQASLDASAPYTLGKDQVRYDGQGNPIAMGISSSTGTDGAYVKGANPVVDAYVKGFQAGTYKASDIPDEYKNLVAQGIAEATGSNGPLSKTSTDAIGIINQLAGLDLNTLSGTGLIGGIEHPSSLFPGTDVQKTQNLAKQLQSTISLANRQQLKGQGQISDFEFRVLGDAATALGIDANGRTNLSPQDFKQGLDNLKLKLQVGPTDLTDDEIQYLHSKEGGGYTPEQIRAYSGQQSFNNVGNTTASKSAGNLPQRNNNPGDVKAGGISDNLAVGKDSQGHLIFKTPEDGFKALTADLTAKINGASKYLPANPTLEQLGKVYAEDPNWPVKVAAIIGVPVTTHTQTIPLDKLVQAVATQEGFYA